MTRVRSGVVSAAVLSAATLAPLPSAPAAVATPVGVEAMTISEATVDGVEYVTREITIAPGGSTGWHYHDGEVFGVIREGTLTHDTAHCTVDGIYPPGAPISEARGTPATRTSAATWARTRW